MLFETRPCETPVPCECCSKVQTSSPNLRWDFLEAPILKPLMKLGSPIKAVTIYITQPATGQLAAATGAFPVDNITTESNTMQMLHFQGAGTRRGL